MRLVEIWSLYLVIIWDLMIIKVYSFNQVLRSGGNCV